MVAFPKHQKSDYISLGKSPLEVLARIALFPWEDDQDLRQTTELIEFIASNKVEGTDDKGRPMFNHVDSTIMTPFQGTKFLDMIQMKHLYFLYLY